MGKAPTPPQKCSRWTRKLFFHEITLGLLPPYLKDYLIPCDNLITYLPRSSTDKTIKTVPSRTKAFESSFFPHCPEALEYLGEGFWNIELINIFKSSILNFVRPGENSVFAVVHDIDGVNY